MYTFESWEILVLLGCWAFSLLMQNANISAKQQEKHTNTIISTTMEYLEAEGYLKISKSGDLVKHSKKDQ